MDRVLVKFIRILHGFTQEEFGRFLGFSRSYVMMVERGHRDLSENYKGKIMEAFNLTTNDILKLKELEKARRISRRKVI